MVLTFWPTVGTVLPAEGEAPGIAVVEVEVEEDDGDGSLLEKEWVEDGVRGEDVNGFESLRVKGAGVGGVWFGLLGFVDADVDAKGFDEVEGPLYSALIWLWSVVLPAPSRPRRRMEYSGCEVAWR